MRWMKALAVSVLVVCTATGCVHRRWGKCARYGAVLGGVAGGLAGGLGVTEYEKAPVSTGEKAAGIGGGIAGGILAGALLGHVICDPEEEVPPPPPSPPAPPPPPAGKPLVTLHGPQFDFNKAVLKPAGKRMVDEAIAAMKSKPDMKVSVEGHTDSIGSDAYNQKLSERRAGTVSAYMVAQGIAPERVTTRGWGEAKPAASNDTEAGRAENRRVEIIAVR